MERRWKGRRTTGAGRAGTGPLYCVVYLFFSKQLRDSGLPADALVGKVKKDISFALRRGTMAQVTTPLTLPNAPSSVEDEELAVNEAGWNR